MNQPAPPEQATDDAAAGQESAPTEHDSGSTVEPIDLDAIDADLDGVERALERLADGTYWTDEVTGEALDEGHLATHPTARRAAG